MVPRLIYADWLDEHGQHGTARRFRNPYDAKLLLTILPPIQTVIGPYEVNRAFAFSWVRRSEFESYHHCVLQIQAERGGRRHLAGPQTQESIELGPTKGGGIWFRYYMGATVEPTVLLDMSFDRPGTFRNYTAQYAPVTAEDFTATLLEMVRNAPVLPFTTQ
jgi:hypothetical protein